MTDFASKRFLVTGGAGFLGSHVVRALEARGAKSIIVSRRAHDDLTREVNVECLLTGAKPDIVIHLAAALGGIGANMANPGGFFYENLVMGVMTMEYARRAGAEKFVGVGTVCSYPKHTPVPFKEEDLWNGFPEESNAPYGLAKKMLLVQGQAYRRQYGFHVIHLLPVNLYGPGGDVSPESSHVIPALVRKCLEAVGRGAPEIVCWGDGSPTREFLYVEDCAEGFVMAAAEFYGPEPVNLGTGKEISIKDLVTLIAELTGFSGRVAWDTSRPNGQPRRCLDTARAWERFGFRAKTGFREGLQRTIEWYRQHCGA